MIQPRYARYMWKINFFKAPENQTFGRFRFGRFFLITSTLRATVKEKLVFSPGKKTHVCWMFSLPKMETNFLRLDYSVYDDQLRALAFWYLLFTFFRISQVIQLLFFIQLWYIFESNIKYVGSGNTIRYYAC